MVQHGRQPQRDKDRGSVNLGTVACEAGIFGSVPSRTSHGRALSNPTPSKVRGTPPLSHCQARGVNDLCWGAHHSSDHISLMIWRRSSSPNIPQPPNPQPSFCNVWNGVHSRPWAFALHSAHEGAARGRVFDVVQELLRHVPSRVLPSDKRGIKPKEEQHAMALQERMGCLH